MADMADESKAPVSDSGSDTDSSTDFFISKRKPILRAASIPPPREPSPIYVHDSSESDYSDSERRKRRRVTKKKEASLLPEWTRQVADKKERKGSSKVMGGTEHRGGTEERFASSALGLEDEEGRRTKAKGRKRVELTPPPPLSSKKLEDLETLVESMYAETVDGDEDDDVVVQPKSPEKFDDTCSIVTRMQMDPSKQEKAPPVAVKHWTKARTILIKRTDTLFRVMEAIGDSLNKAPDDIILVYEGERCYSRQTPIDLRIRTDARVEMLGYEKYHYDIIEAERRARLENLDKYEDPVDLTVDDNTPASPSGVALDGSPRPGPQNGESNTILILVRGNSGEARLRVRKTVTASKVLKHYCTKVGLPMDDIEKLQLVFDGSGVDAGEKIGDLDVEDGDILDVRNR